MNELKKALMSVSAPELIAVGRRIAGDNNYSDEDLDGKFVEFRRPYPGYDTICSRIQNNGKPLMQETPDPCFRYGTGPEGFYCHAEERDRYHLMVGIRNRLRGR